MTEREYLRLKGSLEAEFTRKLDALNTVFEMSGGDLMAATKAATNKKKDGNATRGIRGELTTAISKVLPEFEGNFKTSDLLAKLKARNPNMNIVDSSVSSALVRFAEAGGPLELVQQGKGRRPAIYRNHAAQKAQKAG